MNLAGKRVLVTGGAIRIGAVLTRAFARAGMRVAIHCFSSRAEAEQLLAELGGHEAGHCVVQADLTREDAAECLLEDAGTPDFLVNNAATFLRKPFLEETREDFSAAFDVNFFAPLTLLKAFARKLRAEGRSGAAVNLLDQAVAGRDPDSFSYLLSKKMLKEATETAALALAPDIRVNGVAPGAVLAPKGLEHLKMARTLRLVPLGRAVPPEDIADAVLFLLKNESVTGSILFVDGGQHLYESTPRKNPSHQEGAL